MSVESEIIDTIRKILLHQGLPESEIDVSMPLYDEGVGLDSMCVAELSAVLEKKYGQDPYTSGLLPETVRDLVEFYEPPE